MKVVDLGTSVKWQKTDKRNVADVREKVISDIDFSSGLILEIGCAAGNFYKLMSLSSRFNNHYVGVDLNCKQIDEAKKKFKNGRFICGDILKRDSLLRECRTIVSFQVFEHIQKDFDMFKKIEKGKNIIFSVPNFPYRGNHPDGHRRFYELDGWVRRYENLIDFLEVWTIKHYYKNRKIFVFQGVRR